MQIKPNEPYEEWAERVRQFEYGLALQRIADGHDANEVMEKMSKRVIDKLLHPIFKSIRESVKPVDMEKLKQSYYDNYESIVDKRADHVLDD